MLLQKVFLQSVSSSKNSVGRALASTLRYSVRELSGHVTEPGKKYRNLMKKNPDSFIKLLTKKSTRINYMELNELMRMIIILITFCLKYYCSFNLLFSSYKETFPLKLSMTYGSLVTYFSEER